MFGAWFFFVDTVETYEVIRVATPISLVVCIVAAFTGARLMKLGIGKREE